MANNTKNKSNIAGMALKFTLYIVLFLVSLAIYVGAGIIIFGWDWSLFYDAGFWVRSSLLAIANLSMGITAVSFVYDLLNLKEKEYNELETVIKKEATQLLGHKLTKDVIKINWKNKRDAWISKIEVKLDNLINNISHKLAEEIETEDEKNYSRKAKRYLKRKAKYEEMLTEEWINDYLHYQNIDYEEITQTEIIYGIKVFKSKKSMLDRDILRKAIFAKLGTGLLFSAMSTLGAFIVPAGYLGYATFYIMLGINLFTMLANIGFSIFKAYTSHDKKINNAVIRLEILKNHKSGYYDRYEEVPLKKFERKIQTNKEVVANTEQAFKDVRINDEGETTNKELEDPRSHPGDFRDAFKLNAEDKNYVEE